MSVTINGNGAVTGLGDITYSSANPVISGSSLASLKITSPNGESRYFFGELGNTVSSQMSFYDSTGAQKIRIAAGDGDSFFTAEDILFGTTSQVGTAVSGAEFHSGNGMELRCGISGTGNSTQIRFYNGNGEVGAIRTNGSSTVYHTSSDYRRKENAVAISDGITRLKNLKPYRFNFKADSSTILDGFFAHEVSSVVPEAISGTKDEVVTQAHVDSGEKKESELGDPIYQAIDQSKLVPLLTAALQEAVGKIETLETKVAALEAA